MPLVVLGINHRSADVDVRERLAVGDHELPPALAALLASPGVEEGALLSTCNRTEVYAVMSAGDAEPEGVLADYLAGWRGLSRHEFDGRLYSYRGGAAVSHLFSVAAGIDSMIVGEPDIQRQVRKALEAAQESKSVGTRLNKLFQDALVAGKRARTETEISRGSFSIGAAAVELATQIFGESLAGNTVLVLGAGKMSEVAARHLQARGAPTVIVANRTYDKAVHLAARFGGKARRFDELTTALLTADIVVCSTAAPHPVVTRQMVKEVMRARHNRPLFLIDIAVPRDVEAAVDSLDNVYLYNIDHLQQMVLGARGAREAEIAQAREIVDAAAAEYLRWGRSLEVSPLIVAVREKLVSVSQAEITRMRAKLPGLTENEWRVIEAGLSSMVGKIAHSAIGAIKSSAMTDNAPGDLDAIRRTFGLEEPATGALENGMNGDRPVQKPLAGAATREGK